MPTGVRTSSSSGSPASSESLPIGQSPGESVHQGYRGRSGLSCLQASLHDYSQTERSHVILDANDGLVLQHVVRPDGQEVYK